MLICIEGTLIARHSPRIPSLGVEFSFNNQMYKQLDGVTMGIPLGPALSDVFVGFHESRLFDNTANQMSTSDMWTKLLPSLAPG